MTTAHIKPFYQLLEKMPGNFQFQLIINRTKSSFETLNYDIPRYGGQWYVL